MEWKFGFFFFPGRLLSSFPVEKAKLCDLCLKELFVIKAGSLQLNSSHRGGRECKKKMEDAWHQPLKEVMRAQPMQVPACLPPPWSLAVSTLWSTASIKTLTGWPMAAWCSIPSAHRWPEPDQPCYINNILTPGCVNWSFTISLGDSLCNQQDKSFLPWLFYWLLRPV